MLPTNVNPLELPGRVPLAPGYPLGLPWVGRGASPTPIPASPPPGVPPLKYRGGHVVGQRHKSWSGVSASFVEMRCDGRLDVDLSADAARLSVALEEVGGRFEVQPNGARNRASSHKSPLPLSVIAAGFEAHGRADHLRFMRHLILQFDLAVLARMAEDEIDLSNAFAPRLMFGDAGIMQLAALFAEECSGDEPYSRLYGDKLSIALLLALSRLGNAKPRVIQNGRLAPWQLRRVTDYLVAHVADDIQLQELSDLANLSRSHFSRAFKTSTGLAPHQWLLQARIAKAKELLLTSKRPLARIAVDVGFADQSHFTRMFARTVGESPGAWQRARRV